MPPQPLDLSIRSRATTPAPSPPTSPKHTDGCPHTRGSLTAAHKHLQSTTSPSAPKFFVPTTNDLASVLATDPDPAVSAAQAPLLVERSRVKVEDLNAQLVRKLNVNNGNGDAGEEHDAGEVKVRLCGDKMVLAPKKGKETGRLTPEGCPGCALESIAESVGDGVGTLGGGCGDGAGRGVGERCEGSGMKMRFRQVRERLGKVMWECKRRIVGLRKRGVGQ